MRKSRQPESQTIFSSPLADAIPAGSIGTPLRKVLSDAGEIWVPATDGVMLPFLEKYGTWEPEEGELLTTLGTSHMRFLDIGASFGYFSRLMARRFPNARIDSFEPHPAISKVAALNMWPFADRATVWPTALGASTGSLGLSISENNIGDTRVWSDEMVFDLVAPVSRLDDLIVGPVDLVKMDVQGFETDVFAGMTRVIRESPSIRIVVEFWPSAIRERGLRPGFVLAAYRDLGFEICLVRGTSPSAATEDEIVEFAESAGPDGQANLMLRRPLA